MNTESQNKIVDSKWLAFANDDLRIVYSLWRNKEKINRGICFHAQQYVEKILKGILEKNQIRPPRIHDLIALNEICKEVKIELPLSEDNLQFLTSVYIDTRYPPDVGLMPNGEPTEEHSRLAYQIVKKLDKWIKKIRD
jgi:HEPN domain-containing protein